MLVPGLRAPVATVAALRALTALAPGRVRVAVGAGFTGRFTLGLGPVRLEALEREVADLRALAAGDERPHVEGGRPVRDMPVPGAEGDGGGAGLRRLPRRAGPRPWRAGSATAR